MPVGLVMFELAQGAVDGSNTDFSTSLGYVAGSVRAWIPTAQKPSYVTELGGQAVQLAEAPLSGDAVFLYYRVP